MAGVLKKLKRGHSKDLSSAAAKVDAVQKESKKDKDEKASLEKQSASSDKSSYSTSSDYKMYRAVFDFNGQNSDDLVFKKDDRLRVLKDSQTSEWWIAHNMRTGQEGSIPANYVTADDSSHEAQKWFFKTGSVGVENLLTDASLKPGTFLVRICSDKKNYVLCLRGDTEPGQQLPKILRYRIQKTPDNKYLISEKLVFDSLVELVDHYHRMLT